MSILEMLCTYLQQSHSQIAVVMPLVISLCGLALYGSLQSPQLAVWALATVLSCWTARWDVTSETMSLFIFPWFFMYQAGSLYAGGSWNPGSAYGLNFLSLFSVDVYKSYEMSLTGAIEPSQFYWGVGGAGVFDELFVIPLVAVALVAYVRWRRTPAAFPKAAQGDGHEVRLS